MKQDVVEKADYAVVGDRAALEFDYGDTIEKEWICRQFSIVFPDLARPEEVDRLNLLYMSKVESLRGYLLKNHLMDLKTNHRRGYLIIMPKNQVNVAYADGINDFNKMIANTKKRLTYLNTKGLSDSDIRNRDDKLGKLAALAAFSKPYRN
jgi:hypothetical protein